MPGVRPSTRMEEEKKLPDLEAFSSGQVIPYTIDILRKNKFYEVKIENVYDPSKFWIVIKFNELKLFTKYLTTHYIEKKLVIPRKRLKHGLICIVLRNSAFYRATLLPALLPEKDKLRVFLVDYGITVNVGMDNVFYIAKKHTHVPRFSVRATLAYISPANQLDPWCSSDLHHFIELLSEKKLTVKVLEIDPNLKILHIDIFRKMNGVDESISSLLVESGIGSYSKYIEEIKEQSKYKRKVKYMHLVPTFNALEKGVVPCSLWEANLLKCVPTDLLYKDYYQYQYDEC
ncbi:hypothetical protein JTB14_025999 [Gonioctena quinquepunctata]|nr:hypothetical protein JTB14_025999 [Gonioctena quinquepunctata]